MTNLNCPTCSTHLDEHDAGPCLDRWAADIFGWPEHEWTDNEWCQRCVQYRILVEVTEPCCQAWRPSRRITDTMLALDHYPNVILSRCDYAAPAMMVTIQLADSRSVCGEGDTLALAGVRAALRAELEGK